MKLEIMDGPKTSAAEQPSVTVIQTDGSSDSSAGGKKSRVTRKHVIIGVTCAVVVAMVITGVLVGVKFYLDSANELVTCTFEFKLEGDRKVKEDVGADVKENYVQYHLKGDDDSEVTVIEDFNRRLRMIKLVRLWGSVCYITRLNASESASPQAVLNATATDETLKTVHRWYNMTEAAIKDHSMLGAHGQKLCNNLNAYWLTQTSDDDETTSVSTDVKSRQKRHDRCRWANFCWRCRKCFMWWCRWKDCCEDVSCSHARYHLC